MHEIAVAGVQLDGVEARLGGAGGRGPERRHDRLDLVERELVRRLLDVHGRRHRRRRDRLQAGHDGDT